MEIFTGVLGLIVGIFLFFWAVLMFISPFYWYGTYNRTRANGEKLDELIRLQTEHLNLISDVVEPEEPET